MKRKFWLNNPYSLQEFCIYFKEHVTCFTRKGPPKHKNLLVHKLGNTHTGTICRELSFGFCDIWKDF